MPRRNRNAAYKRPRANADAFYGAKGKVVARDFSDAPEAVEKAKLNATALDAYFANEQPTYILDDARLGKKLGMSADVVRAYRHRHNIPAFVNRMQNAIAELRESNASASRSFVCEQNHAAYLKTSMERMEKDNKVDCRIAFVMGLVFGVALFGLASSIILAFQ